MCRKNGINKIFSYVLAIGLFFTAPLSGNAASVSKKETGINFPESVYVCGTPIGMRLQACGLMVTGYKAFLSEGEEYINPAKNAGVMIGDRLLELGGKKLECADDLASVLKSCGGSDCSLLLKRGEETLTLTVKPIRDFETGEFKIGVWVKDCSAGIGTLTFYDKESGFFGALGHGISDSSTHDLFPAEDGDAYSAIISGVRKGCSGYPGELKGYFREDCGSLGKISENSENGIYGTLNSEAERLVGGREISVDADKSVHKGAAYMISTVDENGPKEYKVYIDSVNIDEKGNKGIALHVSDEELLKITGGIVQGLSGSPIVQDGELVGAVTHVLVNDPTRGYGILIENMLAEAG